MPGIRSTARWQRVRAHVLATHPLICPWPECKCPTGRTIDLNAPPRSSWSATVDHIEELQDGGDPFDETNLTPSHLACNGAKGNKAKARRKAEARTQRLNPSRRW